MSYLCLRGGDGRFYHFNCLINVIAKTRRISLSLSRYIPSLPVLSEPCNPGRHEMESKLNLHFTPPSHVSLQMQTGRAEVDWGDSDHARVAVRHCHLVHGGVTLGGRPIWLAIGRWRRTGDEDTTWHDRCWVLTRSRTTTSEAACIQLLDSYMLSWGITKCTSNKKCYSIENSFEK